MLPAGIALDHLSQGFLGLVELLRLEEAEAPAVGCLGRPAVLGEVVQELVPGRDGRDEQFLGLKSLGQVELPRCRVRRGLCAAGDRQHRHACQYGRRHA